MAFGLVQQSPATAQTAVLSFTVAWPQATKAGNLLVAVFHLRGNATVTNTQGWVQAASIQNGLACQAELWYKPNCTAAEVAPIFSVDVALSGVMLTLEFNGADRSSPLHGTDSNTATNAAVVVAPAYAKGELGVWGAGDSQGAGADTWFAPVSSAFITETNKIDPPSLGNGFDGAYVFDDFSQTSSGSVSFQTQTDTASTLAAVGATFRAADRSPVTISYASN